MKRSVILQSKTSKWWQIFFSVAHVKNQKRFLSTENTSYKGGRKKHLTVGCNRWQYNIQALKHGCAKITQWKPQGLQRKMGVWEQHAKELSQWHVLKNFKTKKNFKTEPYSQHMLMVENSYRLCKLAWNQLMEGTPQGRLPGCVGVVVCGWEGLSEHGSVIASPRFLNAYGHASSWIRPAEAAGSCLIVWFLYSYKTHSDGYNFSHESLFLAEEAVC